jgi:hypothetical protein
MLEQGSGLYETACLNLGEIMLLRGVSQMPAVEAEDSLTQAIKWGERARDRWERHYHKERAITLVEQLQGTEWRDREQALSAYEQAQQLEQEGQAVLALSKYQAASQWVGLKVKAAYATYRLSDQVGRIEQAEEARQYLTTLVPEVKMDTVIGDLRLLGYDLDMWSLEWDEEDIPITLYWETSAGASTFPREWLEEEWSYIKVHNRLYQLGTVRNLLPNGGFEQDLFATAIIPFGYRYFKQSHIQGQEGYVKFLESRYSLALENRNGRATQVAAISNMQNEVGGLSTFESIVVQGGKPYLFGGWMRVNGNGASYLAGEWRRTGDLLKYWQVARWVSPQSWQSFASLSISPEKADTFFPLFLGQTQSEVLFDNVLLFPVSLPSVSLD